MKKIVGAIVFGLVFGFVVISVALGGNSKGKQEAINKVKMYEMQTNIASFSETTKGMSLSVYVEKYVLQLMNAGRMIESGHWDAYQNSDKSGYLVSYTFKLGNEDNTFQWEVKDRSIRAINGKAKSATPELDVAN